jgi:ribonuclease VapC
MTQKVVLDASAVLALLFEETGAPVVAAVIGHACLSTVNLVEVLSKLVDRGYPEPEASKTIGMLGLEVIPFDAATAELAAALREPTRAIGLSLGDRACLALAYGLNLPVLTADRAWVAIQGDIDIRIIR